MAGTMKMFVFTCLLAGAAVALDQDADVRTVPLRRETVPVYRAGEIVSYKSSYAGTLRLANQEFQVIFDTGSGHVVVPSSKCEVETCLVHNRYDMAESKTSQYVRENGTPLPSHALPEQATVHFGTGNLTGEYVRENVCAGDMCISMNVLSAVRMSNQPFRSFNFDGIVGLGLPSLSMSKHFSTIQMLQASGMEKTQFSVYLTEGEEGEESEISFGGSRDMRFAGKIHWAPVVDPDEGHWQVRIKSFKIGDVSIGSCDKCDMRTGENCCKGIVDTGTSHLGVPAFHNADIMRMLSQPVSVTDDGYDCREVEAPTIEIEFEGFSVRLNAANYMRRLPLRPGVSVSSPNGVSFQNIENNTKEQRVPEPKPADKPAPATSKAPLHTPQELVSLLQKNVEVNKTAAAKLNEPEQKECRPRLIAVNLPPPLGPNLFILGEPVLHRYYTVYDWHGSDGHPQIGFGRAMNKRYVKHRSERMQAGLPEHETSDEDHIVLFQTGFTVHPRVQKRRVVIVPPSTATKDDELPAALWA